MKLTHTFKIFKIGYHEVETFSGYSDGYGKQHEYHPTLRPAGFLPFEHDEYEYESELEAEDALRQYGDQRCQYVIQKIYNP